MEYINRLENLPGHVTHHTFFCQLYQHDLGFHIYLPPDYAGSGKQC